MVSVLGSGSISGDDSRMTVEGGVGDPPTQIMITSVNTYQALFYVLFMY